MDDYILEGFIKAAGKKPKCEGTESSPVGSPRQKAFCGRMCGHKKKNTKSDAKKDPDSCINQALRRWKCRCSSTDQANLLIVSETILDDFLGKKTAQKAMDEEAHELLSMYVAFTRALYSLHQQNHWASINYGDHLLFQRLYEESSELVDDAAERTIGLCGSLLFEGTEAKIVNHYDSKDKSLQGLIKSSLSIEKAFQAMCQKTYDTIKEKGMMTLGLDDLIMAQADVGETHLYLLQQALKGHEK